MSTQHSGLALKQVIKYLTIAATLLVVGCNGRVDALPDFDAFADVSAMKHAFYAYMRPIVADHNKDILDQRTQLLALQAEFQAKRQLGWFAQLKLRNLAAQYELDDATLGTDARITELLLRIDIVPADLAIVQAAKESGWGRSRFAVEHNNLFGQWCYKPGCGAVPKRRPKDKNYEVAEFHSVSESVRRYMNNLNTHERYSEFRRLRALRRASGRPLEGVPLAVGLLGYSQRGQAYVKELLAMLEANRALFTQASAR